VISRIGTSGIRASGDLDNQTLYALGAPEMAGPAGIGPLH
jgi:hypothetical protein